MIHWLGLIGMAVGVETTDFTGVWESESGSKIMVPMMRDGRMPIVLMGRRPTVLVGDWKWNTQSLELNGASIYLKDQQLIVRTAGKETPHTLHHSIPSEHSSLLCHKLSLRWCGRAQPLQWEH